MKVTRQSEKPKQFDAGKSGPLDGIRVLDLSRLVAGNLLSMQLADFGADVLKIEPPEGDPLRAWKVDGHSFFWKIYGRNKRSCVLNLRHPPAMQALWALMKTADVFIENFRPGTLEKMGLSPAKLLACNPDLIIVRVSGYGQTGPNAHLPGFGTLVEAASGFACSNGFADREPVLPPLALADMVAGIYGASAVTTALFARERGTACGQVIDLSLLESIFSFISPEMAIYQHTGVIKDRVGSASDTASPRNVYRCADGLYLALSGSMQTIAERVFRAIGRPEMITDPRFATNTARVKNRSLVDEAIGAWFSQKESAEALEIMQKAGATVGPVYSVADAMQDAHFKARVYANVEDHDLGSIPMHNVTPRLSGTPGSLRRAAPELGADTEQILKDVGLSDGEIERVKDV
ncbi:MAG: CoA transferase [Rhodobacteraceae bacterium]|nr:CoA transferase [Paracoccaceae bacterium]